MPKACIDQYPVSDSSQGKILGKIIKHDNNVSIVPQNILSILKFVTCELPQSEMVSQNLIVLVRIFFH